MNLKSACAAVFTAAVAATAAGEPGLARFVYARNTFVTNFHSDVWTKRGQSMDTPKDVPLPEIEGWRQKRERAMVLQGALTVAKDGTVGWRKVLVFQKNIVYLRSTIMRGWRNGRRASFRS